MTYEVIMKNKNVEPPPSVVSTPARAPALPFHIKCRISNTYKSKLRMTPASSFLTLAPRLLLETSAKLKIVILRERGDRSI